MMKNIATKVRPFISPTDSSKSKAAAMVNNSMLMSSMASLTPSQLDNAIMEMLNIRNEDRFCQANPITEWGKKIQLLQILAVTMVPIVILLGECGMIFGVQYGQFKAGQEVRSTIRFSVDVADLVHALQNERDISALYVSAIGTGAKALLLRKYEKTDEALDALNTWAGNVRNSLIQFRSKIQFQNFLNKHRYELDILDSDIQSELEFYTSLISVLMAWFGEAITETQTGAVWKQLVALNEIMEAKEMFGIERAYGSIYFIRGGFSRRDDYLKFVESQDVANATLRAAREYSTIVDDLYLTWVAEREKILEDVIRPYRYQIRENPFRVVSGGSVSNATFWFDNVTLYLDALLTMQQQLGRLILSSLTNQEGREKLTVIIVGTVVIGVIIMCPVILKAVTSLTREIQDVSSSLADRTKALNKEKRKTDSLLYQMLPKGVADQLKSNKEVSAESFQQATILFSDIVGFTKICARSSPVVQMLDDLYTCFDDRIKLYDVYKVETIGDAYMVASGLPKRNGERHAAEIGTLALDLLGHFKNIEISHLPGTKFHLRIGCNTGPVVAGVVGVKMPHYCVFGETVVIASQMEETGKADKIQVSDRTHAALVKLEGFEMKQRKHGRANKAPTYWLLRREGMERTSPERDGNEVWAIYRADSSSSSESNDELREPASFKGKCNKSSSRKKMSTKRTTTISDVFTQNLDL